MKWWAWLLVTLGLAAEEPEKTVWYDADGNVAVVEEGEPKPVEEPFVADWRKREIERRERGYRPSGWSLNDEVWRGGYHGRHAGFSYVTPAHFRPFHAVYDCYRPIRRGSRAAVIIRW